MIVYAAIDLRRGRVVQLVGGRPERERVSLPDPVAVACDFVAHGFSALHVVDLDGALDEGSNADAIAAIVEAVQAPVQVGGGIRDADAVARWLDAGAARVMVGTRAIGDHQWLSRVARRHRGRLLVAADIRGDEVVTHGWTRASGMRVADFFARVAELPLAGLLVTDVGREGRLAGVDSDLFARLAARTELPIIAAGGVGSLHDLQRLDAAGLAGAVIGTALYTGAIDPGAAAQLSEESHHGQAP